jgi:hypothetical protein
LAAITVAACITRLQREFEDITQAIAEDYLSASDREILTRMPLRVDSEDINLTSGTQLYAFAADTVVRVASVEYLKGSAVTNRKVLTATSIAELDLQSRDWRAAQNEEPTHFFITVNSSGALRIGFYPTPNTTTSGGYPIARVHLWRAASLVSGGSLPSVVRKPDMYVWGAAWLYAEDYRSIEEAQMYKARFENAVREEEEYLNSFAVQDTKRLVYDLPYGGVV